MIAYIKGKIIDLDFTSITVLTSGGIGYEILINEIMYTHFSLGEDAEIFIYDHITENSRSLFGFIEQSDKKVFTELIKISGVGGKVAMQILSLGVHRLMQAVGSQDNKTIESIKGIGKKMAEKIILELKDKDLGISISAGTSQDMGNQIEQSLAHSIKSTLINMGYNPAMVDEKIGMLPKGMEDAGTIIPYIIKELS